jgi:uncharacterized LabA/DUF88 family protein
VDRVCVFIDGSGFYFSLKRNNHPTRVDYYELSKALTGPDRKLIRTFYFNSAYDSSKDTYKWKQQQSFLDSLDRTPYLDVKFGRLVGQAQGGFREKGTDVLLASLLVYYAAKDYYDTAIVITEDPDFVDGISKVKEMGKHVEIGLFPDSQPRELLRSSDMIIPMIDVLTRFKDKIFPDIPEVLEEPGDNAFNKEGAHLLKPGLTTGKVANGRKK